jgi:hypothetical protein
VIVAPNSRILAGPMGIEEGILYAECNLEIGIQAKLRHDFAGHYNRPDIFHLQINRAAPRLYSVHGEKDLALPNARATATRLGTMPEASSLLAPPAANTGPADMPSAFTIDDDDGTRGT